MANQAYPCPTCAWVMPVVSIGVTDDGQLAITHACLRDHPGEGTHAFRPGQEHTIAAITLDKSS